MGDDHALARLQSLYLPRIQAIAFQYARHADDAADWAMDAWIRATRCLPQLEDPSRFEPWLWTLVRRSLLDSLRRRNRQPQTVPLDELLGGPLEESLSLERPDPDAPEGWTALLKQLDREALALALKRLKREHPELARTVCLHVLEGIPLKDLAPVAATARSRFGRGVRLLRRYLDEDPTEGGSRLTPIHRKAG
jgi:RNA polymerase sigma-70 factor (ECF subfamily)